jgi:hypothetical protein
LSSTQTGKRTEEETRALLDMADALAQFAGIDPGEEVENFRRLHPNFVPEVWWTLDYDGCGELIWSRWQQLLDVEWGRFSLYTDRTLALLTMWMSVEESPTPVTELHRVFTPTMYPYQRAVLFLAVEPWRAKVCRVCGMAFIADHASRKYCSLKCSAPVIGEQHRAWGRANNWGREKSMKKSP